MIYFAQLPTGSIKIGFSDDVETRLADLERHYGVPLSLLHTEPGGRTEEREWHDRFAHARFGRTEQFRPVPELMEVIGRPLLVGANPDAVEAVEPSGRTTLIILKGTPAQAEWLDKRHRETHIPKSVIVRLALAHWAESNGLPPFPVDSE